MWKNNSGWKHAKKENVKCYAEPFRKLRHVWKIIAVDETTNVCGRYITDLLIGINYLKILQPNLIVTIIRFIQESLSNMLFPNAIPSDKNVLMLTGAAAYMVKAGIHFKSILSLLCTLSLTG